ncbi:type VII secretion target [Nocardia sp. CC227C]|uniref:type VII secretion target n=1 Tax=Nocardia sp. CC227C TaxID=3044562 RepID=UPI00278BE86B|nr:type VII secretion target [Nocardia sp. CC227C]
MVNQLRVDPDNLRALADRHDRAAAKAREAGRIPHGWIGRFESQYGTIAEPVRAALADYFDRRHRRSERQAARHERTRDILRAAANELEHRDHDSGRNIGDRGRGFDPVLTSGGPVPVSTPPTATNPVVANPVVTNPPTVNTGPSASNSVPTVPIPGRSVAPQSIPEDDGPAPVVTPTANTPNRSDPQHPGWSVLPPVVGEHPRAQENIGRAGGGGTAPPPGGPAGLGSPAPAGVTVSGPGAGPPPVGGLAAADARSGAQPAGVAAQASPTAVGAAATTDGNRRRSRPAHEETDSVDLTAARTLLASILHAVGSTAPTVAWSVAALRSPVGMALCLTTNEGRGWLPPGLYLPRNLSTPWRHDDAVGVGESEWAVWEQYTDPARILVEFARIFGPKANARLTALVSSEHIDPRLLADNPDAAVGERVEPANEVNLRSPGPRTVDRLGFAGSADALAEVFAVPRATRAAQGLALAVDAHHRVRRADATPVAAVPVEQLREQTLALLEAGEPAPKQWWAELRQADNALAEVIRSHAAGDRETIRSLVFQRRCTELVLLLDGEPGYRRLRDQFYTYEQIVKHPAFADAPVVSVGPVGEIGRPVTVPDLGVGSDSGLLRAE